MSRSFAFLLTLALAGSLGCAGKPVMKLNHAEVSGVSLGFPPQAAIAMTVYVDVSNPHSYDVAVRAVRGTVTFLDRYPLQIDFRAPADGVWLGANATTPMTVPVQVPVALAAQLMREGFTQQNIPFHLVGKADVTATRTFKLEKDDYEIDEIGNITKAQLDAAVRSVFPFGIMGG